jgi:hypothetical protein
VTRSATRTTVGPLTCGFGSWLSGLAARAARNPAWYQNIAAHPGQMTIELHGAERDEAWRQITAAALPSGLPAQDRPRTAGHPPPSATEMKKASRGRWTMS